MAKEIHCIIKLGGSAVTEKNNFETANVDGIKAATSLLLQCQKARTRCIIVHGAGSFGHHQAKQYSVNHGYSSLPPAEQHNVKTGFCKTRQSVTKLLKIIADIFLEAGLPVITQSPCGSWVTNKGVVVKHGVENITSLVDAGFLPLLHGDCVLDQTMGCKILSGDTIIKTFCMEVPVRRVVFLTDVAGVYDKPPDDTSACLIPRLTVQEDGSLSCPVTTSNSYHDVTGGIKLKLDSAALITRLGQGHPPVFICQIGSPSANSAVLSGTLDEGSGTMILYDSSR